MSAATGIWLLEPSRLHALARLDTKDLTAMAATGVSRIGQSTTSIEGDVAVVSVRGTMLKANSLFEQAIAAMFGGVSTPSITAAVRAAGAEPAVKSLVLMIDSPGGQADGIAELAQAVREVAKTKPVLAAVENALSAAYWVASAATRVVAVSPTSSLGSIGAYGVVVDSQKPRRIAAKPCTLLPGSVQRYWCAGFEGNEATA